MKRLLSGAETAQPPTRPAQEHPHQRDEPRQLEPQRPRASPTIGSRLAEDLELPFQRGEADLVGKLGDPHQPHAQAAGFLCSAQVASTTGRQPLPARVDEFEGATNYGRHQPGSNRYPPPRSTGPAWTPATAALLTNTKVQAPFNRSADR